MRLFKGRYGTWDGVIALLEDGSFVHYPDWPLLDKATPQTGWQEVDANRYVERGYWEEFCPYPEDMQMDEGL